MVLFEKVDENIIPKTVRDYLKEKKNSGGSDENIVVVEPNYARMAAALSDGRYSNYEAVCDLVDNAKDAITKKQGKKCKGGVIRTYVEAKKKNEVWQDLATPLEDDLIEERAACNIDSFVVADNGCGMTKQEAINAFVLGSDRNDRQEGEHGYYGMGLKSASLSLGHKITIMTKVENGDLVKVTSDERDLQGLPGENKKPTVRFATKTTNEDKKYFIKKICNKSYKTQKEYNKLHGTVVRVSDLKYKKIKNKNANSFAAVLRGGTQLGRKYRKILENTELKIYVGKTAVVLADPEGKYIADTVHYSPATEPYDGDSRLSITVEGFWQVPKTKGSGGHNGNPKKGPAGINQFVNLRETAYGSFLGICAVNGVTSELSGLQINFYVDQNMKDAIGYSYQKVGADWDDQLKEQVRRMTVTMRSDASKRYKELNEKNKALEEEKLSAFLKDDDRVWQRYPLRRIVFHWIKGYFGPCEQWPATGGAPHKKCINGKSYQDRLRAIASTLNKSKLWGGHKFTNKAIEQQIRYVTQPQRVCDYVLPDGTPDANRMVLATHNLSAAEAAGFITPAYLAKKLCAGKQDDQSSEKK